MMKKSMLTPAILICSMMMLPVNANAIWLDIVKEFVAGGIKTIVMPKTAKITNAVAESKPDSKPDKTQSSASKSTTEAPKTGAQPTPEDIFDALNKLQNVCNQFASNIPCSVGEGKGLSLGMAREKAIAKGRVELANIMGTYVTNNAEIGSNSDIDEDGLIKETSDYLAKSKLSTSQLVSGAQQYMSYTYIDEEATQINKGKTVYVTTVVMVMNKDVFGKALEDASKDKPLSEQIIKESKKGIIAALKTAIKKI